MFCGVSLKSVAVAIGLSVKLNVTGGERVSIIGGGNIENKELLNEELEGETGDGARSNSWIFNVSLFTLFLRWVYEMRFLS